MPPNSRPWEGGPSSKVLPEDCIKYFLFLSENVVPKCERGMVFEEIHQAAEQLTNTFLGDYLWQREGFRIELAMLDGFDLLCGETNFGDSIEDEWVVTFILRELSFIFPRMWVKVEDNDGQFLLIEAAKTLPRWLNPDNAENRVWINEGRLLIIPPDESDALDSGVGGLTLQHALERLETSRSKLLYSTSLESEAFRRLQKYPQDLVKNNHRALILIPRNLSYIIHQRPAYICAAAEAFCTHDPLSMRSQHLSCTAKPTFRAKDLVEMQVKFTRVSFAQLKSQHFRISKEWSQSLSEMSAPEHLCRLELGMKVACGFEMLLTDPQLQETPIGRDILKLMGNLQGGMDCSPSDQELPSWGKTEDDDSWLDVDYTEFERDLDGVGPSSSMNEENHSGRPAQKELQKLVSRFTAFVDQDDSAESDRGSPDESEVDDMIGDNDMENSVRSATSRETADEIVFSEHNFMDMMKKLNSNSKDLPRANSADQRTTKGQDPTKKAQVDGELYDVEVEDLSRAMEAELLGLGALQGNRSKKSRIPLSTQPIRPHSSGHKSFDQASYGEGSLDYNLAENMLESFKSQAGSAGPAGNLMGLMGIRLPRDDGDSKPSKVPTSTFDRSNKQQ